MAWYAWLGWILFLAWALVVSAGLFLLLAAIGALHKRIEATVKGLFVVAKNVDDRFTGDERSITNIAQFLVKAFGLDALHVEPPRSGSVAPPSGELKN